MTGPDINRPLPGSNAIGQFVIGVSPIGTIPAFDPWLTIISQYANSPTLTALILSFFDALDQTADMEKFFDDVWNIETAVGEGLDVWGRILGVSRVIQVASGEFFGQVGPEGQSGVPYNVGPFFQASPLTDNVALTDPAYRLLLLVKAAANITDGSIPSLNAMLRTLFPNRGNCYVTDGEDMSMTYTFQFPLTPVERAIVSSGNVLPKPTGVSATIVAPAS